MLDRQIGLAGKYPEDAAQIPSTGVTRVEYQRTVDQPHHRTVILAELSQRVGGVGKDAWVVLARFERPPSEIDTLAAGRLRLFGPTVSDERHVAHCRPGERGPVMRIDRDRLLEQIERLGRVLTAARAPVRKCLQVEIVGRELACRPITRAPDLGRL